MAQGDRNIKGDITAFSTHEYDSLRNEMIARIEAINSQSQAALASIIAAWVAAVTLLVLSFNENVIWDKAILIGFDFAQSLALLFPVIILFPLAIKSGENLTQITSISCYIRVFFEENDTESGKFLWEGANNSLSKVNMKRKGLSFGDLYNSEYSVLSIASIAMYLGFSVLNYTRFFSLGGFPWYLYLFHAVILFSSIVITVFTSVAGSVQHSMRKIQGKYIMEFDKYKMNNGNPNGKT